MSEPLVSTIVPVFNGERFLVETLDSILGQTHTPIEIIVVDDGSTDGTADIVRAYGERIGYILQDNAGPATARNTGVQAATGSFIAFLDADDIWVETKIERQLDAFAADPDLDICVSHVQNFWEAELAEEAERMKDSPRARPIAGLVTQTLLTRRSIFDSVGLFDPARSQTDAADWFLRAERAGHRRLLLDDVLVRRRMHLGGISRQQAATSFDEFLRLAKAQIDARRAQTDE